MERHTWTARILPGRLGEYIRRHDAIWPEMTELLNQAGIRNYTIWQYEDRLFGYYECDSVARAALVQAQSPVVARWDAYMRDVMVMEIDPATGRQLPLRQVFYHAGQTPKDKEG